jgi:hypothetical protein
VANIRLELPELHTAQTRCVREARRFNTLACGRRFGKTTLGINLVIEPSVQGKRAAWFSPTYKSLGDVWREVRTTLAPLITTTSEQQRRLELRGGGVIEFWSLEDPDAGRGRAYHRAAIDEAAMVSDLKAIWNSAIRPTLADYVGDAWFMSTPRAMNYFYELYQFGQDDSRPDWMSWCMPTSANPRIHPSEIEAARRDLPERVFAQEYLAQFLPDGAGVFRGIHECVLDGTKEPVKGHEYVFGLDFGRFKRPHRLRRCGSDSATLRHG